jgi:hypothetical protein
MTENQAMLATAAVASIAAIGLGWRYKTVPKHDQPWWVVALCTAGSSVAATCLARYAEKRRLQR